jgi:copper chaperone
MQFQIHSGAPDPVMLGAALRRLDPGAGVVLDAARGRLEVLSTAGEAEVLGALDAIGCVATPLLEPVHISGGSTCCGHCG